MTNPQRPANQWVWIDPNLLQMVGLGTIDDPYMQNGRHLRWFFERLLGFPRTGFHLMRRPCPFHDPKALRPLLTAMGLEKTTENELGTAHGLRSFESGLTISKLDGFTFISVSDPAIEEYPILKIDSKPITMHLGPQYPLLMPQIGPAIRDPAAYVLLVILREEKSGSVLAEGFYEAGASSRLVDRAGMGPNISAVIPPSARKWVTQMDNVEWLRSGAERHMTKELIRARHLEIARRIKPDLSSRTTKAKTTGMKVETLLLHGGLLEKIIITGMNAALLGVCWMPTRLYAQIPEWEEVDRLFLPLTKAPGIFPAWTTKDGVKIAEERLALAPPYAHSPWDVSSYPPPHASVSSIWNDLSKRYLGDAFDRIDDAVRLFLEGELTNFTPQALVEITEYEDEGASAGSTKTTYSPFDQLYAAAADPQMARILGLMTTDLNDPEGSWDYLIGAWFPDIWLLWSIAPDNAKEMIEILKNKGGNAPMQLLWEKARKKSGPVIDGITNVSKIGLFPVISMATSITRMHEPLPTPPDDLQARLKEYPSGKKVQTEVDITWSVPNANLFDDSQSARVFYAARRSGKTTPEIVLNHEDDVVHLRIPIVPTKDSIREDRAKITDRSMPNYGNYEWWISGMDIWGRFSPWAKVSAKVIDLVKPIAPANVVAQLVGKAASAPSWEYIAVSFDWTQFQLEVSPDVVAFEIHLSQGKISNAKNQDPSMWGKLAHAPGATTKPLHIEWPTAKITSSLPSGMMATITTGQLLAEEGGGTRITAKIAPIELPFDANGYANISATITAIDGFSNISPFATRAVATRVDDLPPQPVMLLPGPQLTSYPDARGRAFFCIPLVTSEGERTQVLRASQVALLEAGGFSNTAFFELNEGERVEKLKQLAAANESVFTPDHELPYGETATEHTIAFNALDRSWTVAAVQRISKTGIRSTWPNDPDCFMVIAVRRPRTVPIPIIKEARPGDCLVKLLFEPDTTNATKIIRIFRTIKHENAAEVRRMKPVKDIDVSSNCLDEIMFTDEALFPDIPYSYRAIALGDGSEQSEATEIISVKPWSSIPPLAPKLIQVEKSAAFPAVRTLTFMIQRRDYPVTVFRRSNDSFSWELINADKGNSAAIDLYSFAVIPVSGGYTVKLDDTVSNPGATYTYFIRVRDPRDRFADSAKVGESP
ncbi:MAG: hypothetical protein WAW52_11960 [Methanothrix sp.]